MMGRRKGGQGQFFYSFDLDKVVPADHLVRLIDGFLDLTWVHKELAPYYDSDADIGLCVCGTLRAPAVC